MRSRLCLSLGMHPVLARNSNSRVFMEVRPDSSGTHPSSSRRPRSIPLFARNSDGQREAVDSLFPFPELIDPHEINHHALREDSRVNTFGATYPSGDRLPLITLAC